MNSDIPSVNAGGGILELIKKRCLRLLRNELPDHGGSDSDSEAEADELLRLVAR